MARFRGGHDGDFSGTRDSPKARFSGVSCHCIWIMNAGVMVFREFFSDGEAMECARAQETPQGLVSTRMKKTCYQALLMKERN